MKEPDNKKVDIILKLRQQKSKKELIIQLVYYYQKQSKFMGQNQREPYFIRVEVTQFYNKQVKEMDYEIQMHIQNCENFLRNPENIEPNELSQYFAAYTGLGINDFITSLVQRYFYINLNHPDHLRYIHLLDRLIKYSFPLPQNFVQMFTQCFQMAVQNGRKSIQQELKILRKLWTPILNEPIIQQLRTEVYKNTRIDLEHQLREQSKKFLQQYFEKTLLLNQQDIYQILYRKPKTRIPINKEVLCSRPPQTQFLEPLPEFGKPKKKPKLSEDTEPESKILSKRSQILQIYDKLKNMNTINCRQCGQYFQTQKALQKHKAQHFEQRMMKYKKNRTHQTLKKMNMNKNGVKRQKSVKDWINQIDIDSKQIRQNVIIPQGHQHRLNQRCRFCGCQFDVDIIDDAFVYKNSIRVNLLNTQEKQGQVDILHYQCYHTLITPSTQ